jgi:MGT family glycosyltransferase
VRVLVVGWDSGGGVEAVREVVRKLVGRGHAVVVLGPPGLRPRFETAGASFAAYEHVPGHHGGGPQADLLRDWEVRSRTGRTRRLVDAMFGHAPEVCRDVRQALEGKRFDVVVVDGLVPAAHCAAEAAGVPSVHLLHAPSGHAGGWRDRGRRALDDVLFRRGLAPLNQARRQLGLEPVTRPFAPVEWARRVLVCTSATFDFDAPLDTGIVRYVGPQLDDAQTTQPADPWAWALDGPRVLVAMSTTFMDQLAILHRTARALGELKVSGLMTTGASVDPASVPAPSNVRVVEWVRHADALRCSAVVTHGGHGTVIKALGAGVPLVVAPQGRDQPANAARVTRLGAGVAVRPTVRSLGRAVQRVLADERFTHGARRFARRLAEERDEGLVVDEVERAASLGRWRAAS